MKLAICLLTPTLICFTSCGYRFGPGYSANDTRYFAEPPHVEDRGTEASLVWRYGSMGHYFEPRYKVKDDSLYFSLQGTTSTGHIPGREGRLPITEPDALTAMRTGGASWWGDNGELTQLEVIP